jgi:hypothetical protein
VDYSAAEISQAICLLAFPQGDEEVLYQVAYAMGRGLKVLVIVNADEDLNRFDPRPTRVVEIEIGAPDGGSEAKPAITNALIELVASSKRGVPTRRPPAAEVDGWDQIATGEPLVVATVEQAEELFQHFIADGLSQELIRQLLTEAGCRQSWLSFRIQRHFGGW